MLRARFVVKYNIVRLISSACVLPRLCPREGRRVLATTPPPRIQRSTMAQEALMEKKSGAQLIKTYNLQPQTPNLQPQTYNLKPTT